MRAVVIVTCYLVGLSLAANGQEKPLILLVGTTHEFQDSLKARQNFRGHIERLIEMKPDLICIESIPTWDTVSLKQVRGPSVSRAKKLRDEKQLHPTELENIINELQHLLLASPENFVVRSKLANAYYANFDFWNAYYHWYILHDHLRGRSTEDQQKLVESLTRDSLHLRAFNNQANTEFGNLIFPLAHKLNVIHLENIDDRADDAKFQKLSKHIVKRLLLNLKVFRALRIYKELVREAKAAELNGNLIELINDDAYLNRLVTNIDRLSTRWVKSKKAHQAQQLWYVRNERMAGRIKNISIEKQSKRVIVFVGAAHIKFIARELEKVGLFDIQFYTSR